MYALRIQIPVLHMQYMIWNVYDLLHRYFPMRSIRPMCDQHYLQEHKQYRSGCVVLYFLVPMLPMLRSANFLRYR